MSCGPRSSATSTNGVTPRRFLVLCNPNLSSLISQKIGEDWIRDLAQLRQLEASADDAGFREEWRRIKKANKERLASEIQERTGTTVDPDSLFDIQVKRIHEYKRQHLNVLHVVTLYNRLRQNPALDLPPRTVLFGGKAAPGYFMAKLIIKLIHAVADVVNNDPKTRDRLKVVFLPDFNVKHSQRVFPAGELSEQISMAGKEASGTGNMKFALNGALTIGTLDGANIEIREEVGAENFFLFGLSAAEVSERKRQGYRPGRSMRAIQSCAKRWTSLEEVTSRQTSRASSSRSSARSWTGTSICFSLTTRRMWSDRTRRARPIATGTPGRESPS